MTTTTQYVNSDGVSIAYQVLSEQGPTLLNIPGIVSNLAYDDVVPVVSRYFAHLGRFARVIRLDRRSQGLSDRASQPPTMEQQVCDIEAVRAATGTDRMAIHGISHGAAVAVLYTLAHPDRVTHLILTAGLCADTDDPSLPMTKDNALTDWDRTAASIERNFAGWVRIFVKLVQPGADGAAAEQMITYFQTAGSASTFSATFRGLQGFDVRDLLPQVRVPTLVLHCREDAIAPLSHGRYYAEHIPGAHLHVMEGDTHLPFSDDKCMPQLVRAIESHLTGSVRQTGERVVVSVLFTDIVDSTAQQRTRGDGAWRTLRENFEARSQRCVGQFSGRIVDFTGDGIMAEFATPGDTLRAAQALLADARELGIDIRAGVHAGEAYRIGNDLSGTCINIAARVSAAAGANEILTTEAVRGMVEGGGFTFDSAGEHDLKGIGPRQLVRLA